MLKLIQLYRILPCLFLRSPLLIKLRYVFIVNLIFCMFAVKFVIGVCSDTFNHLVDVKLVFGRDFPISHVKFLCKFFSFKKMNLSLQIKFVSDQFDNYAFIDYLMNCRDPLLYTFKWFSTSQIKHKDYWVSAPKKPFNNIPISNLTRSIPQINTDIHSIYILKNGKLICTNSRYMSLPYPFLINHVQKLCFAYLRISHQLNIYLR